MFNIYLSSGDKTTPELRASRPGLLLAPRRLLDSVIKLVNNERTDLRRVAVFSSAPTTERVSTAARLKAEGWTTVYEASDDLDLVSRRVSFSKYSGALERRLLMSVDHIITPNANLADAIQLFCASVVAKPVPDVIQEPTETVQPNQPATHGFRFASKRRNRPLTIGIPELSGKSSESFRFAVDIARNHPNVMFEYDGTVRTDIYPADTPNLSSCGRADQTRSWDVGLVPDFGAVLTYGQQTEGIRAILSRGVVPIVNPRHSGLESLLPDGVFFTSPMQLDDIISTLALQVENDDFTPDISKIESWRQNFSSAMSVVSTFRAFTEGKN